MLKILNAEPDGYCEKARAILWDLGDLHEEGVSQPDLPEKIRAFDVLIVRLGLQVTQAVLVAGRRLKAVVTATTGLDHIDLDAAAELGVTILSLRGETDFLQSVPATMEHTWALLLSLVRRIPWAFESVRLGEWHRDRFRGRDLSGRRLGLLGMGRIGAQVARYGLAFGMTVGAYDPYCTEWVDRVQRFESPERLLRWSEIVSVHLPLTDETRGFLNRARLTLLPRGAVVVNTARGLIVDEDALVEQLERGHLGGAAVDVVADERSKDHRSESSLLRYARAHDNLLITPHLGGVTVESMARTEVFMAEKLRNFVKRIPQSS